MRCTPPRSCPPIPTTRPAPFLLAPGPASLHPRPVSLVHSVFFCSTSKRVEASSRYMQFNIVCVSRKTCNLIRLCPTFPLPLWVLAPFPPGYFASASPYNEKDMADVNTRHLQAQTLQPAPPPPPQTHPPPGVYVSKVLQCSEARYLHLQVHGGILG